MPRFEPFRGLRYQPEVAPLAQVIAPPYDVISPTERVHLASRHPANAVLVELPEADLSGRPRPLRGGHRPLHRWQAARDPRRRPRAEPLPLPDDRPDGPGHDRRHRGARAGRAGRGERHPAPRADPAQAEERPARPACAPRGPTCRPSGASPWRTASPPPSTRPTTNPSADAYDDDGVRHQLWVLSDADTVEAVAAAIACGARRARRRAPPLRDGADLPGRARAGQRRRRRAPTTSCWRSSSSSPRTS